MVLEPVTCPTCQGIDVVSHGLSGEGKPRYKCRNQECQRCTFIFNYSYQSRLPEVKQQICDMAVNGSSIRDTSNYNLGCPNYSARSPNTACLNRKLYKKLLAAC